jgi:hypothetical protein
MHESAKAQENLAAVCLDHTIFIYVDGVFYPYVRHVERTLILVQVVGTDHNLR